MNFKVSIQGYEGSFHQAAAIKFFGKHTKVLPCAAFADVIKAVSVKDCDAGVMAIENSIAGSILPNYNLLQKSNLSITGEIYLHISQNLLVNNNVELHDIKEVHSHPMALQQCLSYLEKHNWKLIETEDTALSAKHIHKHKSKHIAAIASKFAAELFNLKILAPNIHTMQNNYTRFLLLQRTNELKPIIQANKASVNFHTDHSKGSLAKVLTKIADTDVNLSKLQSFPIPGSNFKYSFHADLEFDSLQQFETVIKNIKGLTNYLKIYGVYKNGKSR